MYARDFDPDDFTAKTSSTSQPSLFVWIQENLFTEAQHNEKIINFGIKAKNHAAVSILYSSIEVDKENHAKKAKQTRTKNKTEQD